MPPKKRGRKPKPKVIEEQMISVPPKKRKGILGTYSVFQTQAYTSMIPEWLKVSIQILLINFHNEGIALLNSIQSEYEAVFKDNKVHPENYGFGDWESMLKSSQFKQHCFVYTEKKMPYVKGYPLPRSAVITMRHNRWEITPHIEPFQPKDVIETAVNNTISEICDDNEKMQEDSSVNFEKDEEETVKDSEETVPTVVEETGPKTPEEVTPTSPEPFTMPKLNPIIECTIISSPEIQIEEEEDQPTQRHVEIIPNGIETPDSDSEYSYYPSGRKRRHGSIDYSIFFRRSDVPESWTSHDDDEPKGSREEEESKKLNESIEIDAISVDKDLVIDEDSKTPRDSALSPEIDCVSVSSSPPHLDPIEDDFSRKKKIPSKYLKSRSPKKRYLRKNQEKSVRRISESMDSNSNSSSQTQDTTGNGKKQPIVESFCKWRFIPVLISSNKNKIPLDAFETVVKNAKPAEIEIHPETIIHKDRDPRLNFEITKEHLEKVGQVVEDKETIEDSSSSKTIVSETNAFKETNEITEQSSSSLDRADLNLDSFTVNEEVAEVEYAMPITNEEPKPNLKITITQEPHYSILKEAQPIKHHRMIPHSAVSLKRFNETNAIPQDNYNIKNLRFSDLWNDTKWKHRFDQDEVPPSRFFKTNVFERWREAWRVNLSQNKLDYIKELQVYEEKPYPSRSEFYLRSALRMVEIDYISDFQFSEPRTPDGENLVRSDEILYYVDFAGAPGGVIEFYNKRRRWASKGFGCTYQKRSYDLYAIPEIIPEYFEAFYGKLNSLSGDGSLFSAETVRIFVNRVLIATKGQGVHVVTTIGNVARVTFEDDNDEKWKYQHLAQIMVALMVLKEGGNMAFKFYDIKSSFVAGLLFILYRTFKYVQISKLHIFAPGSAERVVICIGKLADNEVAEMIKFLQECHKVMAEWYLRDKFSKNKRTIEELIPLSTMEKSGEFMKYLIDSNERLKRTQLEEFLVMMKNLRTHGSIFSKATYRSLIAKTTELWNIGDRPNYSCKPTKHPGSAFKELQVYPEDVCEAVETSLNEYNLYTIFASAQQWRFIPIGNQSRSRGFYLGVDGIPYFFNTKFKEWVPVRDFEFRLPARTLVFAEIVSVFTEDKNYGEELFSIIDGMELAGQNIRNLPYTQRIIECEKFGGAVTKAFFPRMTKITVTRCYDFALLPQFLKRIEMTQRSNKAYGSNSENKTLVLSADSVFSNGCVQDGKQCWFNPSGVLFFEADVNNKPSDFCTSLLSRVYWEWVSEMDLPLPKPQTGDLTKVSSDSSVIITNEDERPIGSVSAKKLIDFVNRYS